MLNSLNLPIPAEYVVPALLAVVVVLAVVAYYGYWLFKKLFVIVGAAGFGVAGAMLVAPKLNEMLNLTLPLGISFDAVVGVVCAIVGALLTAYAFKLSLFLLGAGAGFGAGLIVSGLLKDTVEFFATQTGVLVLGAVCALVAAILTVLLFRVLFILVTSVGGLALAGACLALAVMPEATIVIVAVFAAIGLVLGIFAARKQFLASGKQLED